VVIVNFWLMLSPQAETALKGVAQISDPANTGAPVARPATIDSLAFPLANVLLPETLKLARNFPERSIGLFPQGLWNCYARGEGIHEFVGIREDLQRLAGTYPGVFQVAGCWNVATGDPIGGVGSPWFVTPPGLETVDTALMAGQAKRKFV
jgi:hypothetical protein